MLYLIDFCLIHINIIHLSLKVPFKKVPFKNLNRDALSIKHVTWVSIYLYVQKTFFLLFRNDQMDDKSLVQV